MKLYKNITLYVTSIISCGFYVLLIPNINFTKPLKNFGTFFTTIVTLSPPRPNLLTKLTLK